MSFSRGLQYSDEEFKSKLGVSKDTFEFLHRVLKPELSKKVLGGYQATNTREQLLLGLWRINNSTSDPFTSVAKRFNMNRSTVVASVRRVKKALNKLAPLFNDWPTEGQSGVVHFNDALYMPIPDEQDPTEFTLASLEPEDVVSVIEKAYRQWKSLHGKRIVEKSPPLIHSVKNGRKRPANSDRFADDPDFEDPKLAAEQMKEHIKKCQGGNYTESRLSTLGLLVESGLDQKRPPSPLRTEPIFKSRGSEKWPNAAVWALLDSYQKHWPSGKLLLSYESPAAKRIAEDLQELGFPHLTPKECMRKLGQMRKHYKCAVEKSDTKLEDPEDERPKWLFQDKCAELWSKRRDDLISQTNSPEKMPVMSYSEKWPNEEVFTLLNSYEKHRKAEDILETTSKIVAEDLQGQGICKTKDDCFKKLRILKKHYSTFKWSWASGRCRRKWIFADRCAKIFEPQPRKTDTIECSPDLTVEEISDFKHGDHEMEEEVEGGDFVCGDDLLPDDCPEGQPSAQPKIIGGPPEGHPVEGSLADLLQQSLMQEEKFAEADRQRHKQLLEADRQLLQLVEELTKRERPSKYRNSEVHIEAAGASIVDQTTAEHVSGR